jgi:hypothetical protein
MARRRRRRAQIGAAPQLDPLNTLDFLGGLFGAAGRRACRFSAEGPDMHPFVGLGREAADYADIWRAAVQHNGDTADDRICETSGPRS